MEVLSLNISNKVSGMSLTLSTTLKVSTQETSERTEEIKFSQIGNQRIAYKVRNNFKNEKNINRSIILIHGASANMLSTDSLAAELSKQSNSSQIIQIDLPAHGLSTGPVLENVSAKADVIEQFIAAKRSSQEISPLIDIVGISMGGSIAQELAIRKFEGLGNVVLISTSPEWSHFSPMAELTGDQFNAMYPSMIQSDFAVNTTASEQKQFQDWFPSLIPAKETSLGDIKALISFNAVDRLELISNRTLIIHGTTDSSAPYVNAQLLESKIQQSTLVTIEGETHTYSMKKPGAVAEIICDFIYIKE